MRSIQNIQVCQRLTCKIKAFERIDVRHSSRLSLSLGIHLQSPFFVYIVDNGRLLVAVLIEPRGDGSVNSILITDKRKKVGITSHHVSRKRALYLTAVLVGRLIRLLVFVVYLGKHTPEFLMFCVVTFRFVLLAGLFFPLSLFPVVGESADLFSGKTYGTNKTMLGIKECLWFRIRLLLSCSRCPQ